jgi:hypothetical protein
VDPIPQITPIPSVSVSVNRYNGTRLPVLRIEPVTVTRDLPPSVSAAGPSSGRSLGQAPSPASRPGLDVPAPGLEYPELNVPTQAEFNAVSGNNEKNNNKENKKNTADETAKARELSNKLPPPPAITPPLPRDQLTTSQSYPALTVPTSPAAQPAAPPPKSATTTTATTGATVNLPLLGTVPLPSKESMALASTTAVTATFVAVLGKAAFEASLEGIKPILRLLAIRYKKMRKRELNVEEVQLEFSFAMKRKGKRTLGEMLKDIKEYFSENFFDDLIG